MNPVKYLIFTCLAFLVSFSCDKNKLPVCTCCAGPSAEIKLQSPAQAVPVPIPNTYTIGQVHLAGALSITGEVHPGNTNNLNSKIIYRVNNAQPTPGNPNNPLYFEISYAQGSSSGTYTRWVPIQLLDPGANTITIEAKCLSTGKTHVISTYNITVASPGDVTLTAVCCTEKVQLQMAGTVNGGGGYLRIEKEVGPNWIQEGQIIPFTAGGLTPCYDKSSTLGESQRYRANLVDVNGNLITNGTNGTVFPMVFEICYACCLRPEDDPTKK